jgi:dCMP deaminase
MNKDEYYISIAKAVAGKSKCLKKHYGAVIVKDDEIVATGYNGCCRDEPECIVCTKVSANKDAAEYETCPAVHAEQNAIISASRRDMLGSALYLYGYDVEARADCASVRPCKICLRLIKNAGIGRVLTSSGDLYVRGEDGRLIKGERI